MSRVRTISSLHFTDLVAKMIKASPDVASEMTRLRSLPVEILFQQPLRINTNMPAGFHLNVRSLYAHWQEYSDSQTQQFNVKLWPSTKRLFNITGHFSSKNIPMAWFTFIYCQQIARRRSCAWKWCHNCWQKWVKQPT